MHAAKTWFDWENTSSIPRHSGKKVCTSTSATVDKISFEVWVILCWQLFGEKKWEKCISVWIYIFGGWRTATKTTTTGTGGRNSFVFFSCYKKKRNSIQLEYTQETGILLSAWWKEGKESRKNKLMKMERDEKIWLISCGSMALTRMMLRKDELENFKGFLYHGSNSSVGFNFD